MTKRLTDEELEEMAVRLANARQHGMSSQALLVLAEELFAEVRASRAVPSVPFFDKRAADVLASEVQRLIDRRVIDSRSHAADALLDYLNPAPGESVPGKAAPSVPREVKDKLIGVQAALSDGRALAAQRLLDAALLLLDGATQRETEV